MFTIQYTKYSRLKSINDVLLGEKQEGFQKGRSCIDNLYTEKWLAEKRLELKRLVLVLFRFQSRYCNYSTEKIMISGLSTELVEYRSLHVSRRIITCATYSNAINLYIRLGCSLSLTYLNVYVDAV